MDKRIPRTAEDFISNLTCASRVEIQAYVAEIRLSKEFHERVERNQGATREKSCSSWDFGISARLGEVIYSICRKREPDIVVETGVASGVSSSYILCALEQNRRGELYSIDLPWWQNYDSGWRIPDYLRHRWHLVRGSSSETLLPLLEKVAEIDIFLHDSEHTYQNMLWEFKTAWKYLKPGGLILSHNIDTNNAFFDFCQSRGIRSYSFTNLGGAYKISL